MSCLRKYPFVWLPVFSLRLRYGTNSTRVPLPFWMYESKLCRVRAVVFQRSMMDHPSLPQRIAPRQTASRDCGVDELVDIEI
jgi:hypothetical protein